MTGREVFVAGWNRVRRYSLMILAPGILLGAVWLLRQPAPTPSSEAGVTRVYSETAVSQELEFDDLPASPAASDITITGVLLADQHTTPVSGQAFIGLGYFDAEDLQEYRLSGDDNPERLAELAVVERWLDVPLEITADGDAQMHLDAVPFADVYRLVAMGTGMGFYFADQFGPDGNGTLQMGDVPAQRAAALEVQISDIQVAASGQSAAYPVFIQRQLAADRWRLARLLFYPETEPVLQGSHLAGAGESISLYPLTPGQNVDVSVEGPGRMRVTQSSPLLSAGERVSILLDISPLAIEAALLIQLEATIMDEFGEPVSGVRVADHPDQQTRCTASDLNGRCRILEVSPDTRSDYLLLLDPENARVHGLPARQPVYFDPLEADVDVLLEQRYAEITWRLPVHRTIVLDHSLLPPADSFPFPIFTVQKLDQQGRWITVSAEDFTPRSERETLISVAENGIYRVRAAASPWQVLHSDSIDVGNDGGEYDVTLRPGRSQFLRLQILDSASRQPPGRATITLASEFSEQPGSPLAVSGSGEVMLEMAGLELVTVAVNAAGYAQQEFDVAVGVEETVELLISALIE